MTELNGAKLVVKVYGEEENPKDGHKWYVTADCLVIATITFRKYVNFFMYEVNYTEIGIDGKPAPYPSQFKSKKSLQDAVAAIKSHLKIEGGKLSL